VTKIHFPMTTAAVFDDIVYPLHFDGSHQIKQEIDGAISWFCRWCNEEKAVVKARMLISCWSLYLTHQQLMSEVI